MIFSRRDHFTSALFLRFFFFSFFFFFEETNVFTYLHCYRLRNDISEGPAFLRVDSEPLSEGRQEDVNICNCSHNLSPRSEERVVGLYRLVPWGVVQGGVYTSCQSRQHPSRDHFLPGRRSLGVRRLPSGACAPAIPEASLSPCSG